ncbi:MAG: cardiolipin synthase [Candidatus Endomicrobiellum trichonymphae]|uniref:phospholipase D-like domain-containing protein n=1 Tax=Endomicrobium trichonymphae TaxID=1408204 RepID=UPI0027D3F9CD|nr:MAG: cardiolipin synthase [Candidatus Endomicrobium trichonymphae]
MIINTFSNFINSNIRTFLAPGIYVALSVGTTVHILLHKDDVKSSIGWIALVFLSPFLGTILYIFLGINRVKRKGTRLRKKGIVYKKYLTENVPKNLSEKYRQFITFGYNVYPQNFIFGNSIEPLQNGIEAYPEMIKTIQTAKKEILISSYIFDCDSETDKFLEAFKTAIKNGATVKVLIDGIGTLKLFRRSIEKKLALIKGLEYSIFLPPYIPVTIPFVNLRNHRKIMIIDGETAFFGGMNLSKKNVLIDDHKNGILDITFKIKGHVINQMSYVFEDDWEFATGKKFQSLSKDLSDTEAGTIPARIIPDGPDNKSGTIERIAHGAINVAAEKILIVTPYFLPENNILAALEMATMRGVDVDIIIPDKSDYSFMDWAVEPNFMRLVKSGVKIYRTPPPLDHSKIFVVDSEWVFIGSANWDVRSFKLNFESNIEIFSKNLAKELIAIAELKKRKAKFTTVHECKALPLLKRIRNNMYRLLTPYG